MLYEWCSFGYICFRSYSFKVDGTLGDMHLLSERSTKLFFLIIELARGVIFLDALFDHQ